MPAIGDRFLVIRGNLLVRKFPKISKNHVNLNKLNPPNTNKSECVLIAHLSAEWGLKCLFGINLAINRTK